jgi:thymidylate synthase (FAD)
MIFDSEIKNKMIRLTGVWQDHNHDWEHISRGDAGLLEYLYSNKHMTPFECGGELMIEVQAPIMVFREWHRHRTFAFNEFSARYSKMLNLHYVPDTSRIQKQSSINKQGSELQAMEFADDIRGELEDEQQQIYSRYDRIVEQGVAREVARLNTPVSRYSKMRAKTDLRNWLAFLQLRMASNAQWEIRQYANAVAEIVKSIYPRTYALFEEHTLHGVSLSRSEIEQLRRALDSDEVSTKLATKLGIE